jgi:hypothetical protein
MLLGLVLGLAIYNRVLLDFPLPLALYKKLLQQVGALRRPAAFPRLPWPACVLCAPKLPPLPLKPPCPSRPLLPYSPPPPSQPPSPSACATSWTCSRRSAAACGRCCSST